MNSRHRDRFGPNKCNLKYILKIRWFVQMLTSKCRITFFHFEWIKLLNLNHLTTSPPFFLSCLIDSKWLMIPLLCLFEIDSVPPYCSKITSRSLSASFLPKTLTTSWIHAISDKPVIFWRPLVPALFNPLQFLPELKPQMGVDRMCLTSCWRIICH